MYDENQTFIPDSFLALCQDARGRLTLPRAEVAAAYELCEDMANMLVDHCQTIHFRDGVDEDQILNRCHQGLRAPPSQFNAAQAWWVIRRCAELLSWEWVSMPESPRAEGTP